MKRTTFEMEKPDYDWYRIRVLARNGYHIYLNGQKIQTYIWWKDAPEYIPILLDAEAAGHLKKGMNTLAVYSDVAYKKEKEEYTRVGQTDVFLEGLRAVDLLKE